MTDIELSDAIKITTRKNCITAVDTLNAYYKKGIKVAIGHGCGTPSPCADWNRMAILLPQDRLFYSLHIMAHEYAHFLCSQPMRGQSYLEWHDNQFEAAYRECCLILGIFAIPTPMLVNTTVSNWNKKHPDKHVNVHFPDRT